MNNLILNTGVQDFIKNKWDADIVSVLLRKPLFEGISQKELAQQLESKKKAREKLPTWFNSEGIYYPPKLHIEQTSSEATAVYKSNLVDGNTMVDLTGGLGVDSYFFSRKVPTVFHCETNQELSAIANHNFKVLGAENISCFAEDGFRFLKKSTTPLDWIFVDPSRRNDLKGKVFLLKDCEPNIPDALPELFNYSKNILIKVSPLLDISQGIKELNCVKEIHVVAWKNEVKELLFSLEANFQDEITLHAVNLTSEGKESFSFTEAEEKLAISNLGLPDSYLYEPNAAILKAGAFKALGQQYGLKKLHTHSHLYTSQKLIEFPGRRFVIKSNLPYSKNTMKSLNGTKANVTIRNFSITVAELRKKHKIRNGGDDYLFFTKTLNEDKRVLVCKKVAESK